MITIFENEVELSFDNGIEYGILTLNTAEQGVTHMTFCRGGDLNKGIVDILQTFSDEEMVDLLEETLAMLRNKVVNNLLTATQTKC